LRIRTKEFESVSWDEFKSLIAGIDPKTPLGRVVAIRAETDKNVIKNFNRDQKRIYDAWRNRKAETMSPATYEQEMKELEKMFADLCR
jgi:hypothetical protein